MYHTWSSPSTFLMILHGAVLKQGGNLTFLFHMSNVKVVIFINFSIKSCSMEESVSCEISKEIVMKSVGTIRNLFFIFAASREPTGESCCIDTTNKSSM